MNARAWSPQPTIPYLPGRGCATNTAPPPLATHLNGYRDYYMNHPGRDYRPTRDFGYIPSAYDMPPISGDDRHSRLPSFSHARPRGDDGRFVTRADEILPLDIRERKICGWCRTTTTSQWRVGPTDGSAEMGTLCNACGINYRRALAKSQDGTLNLDRLAAEMGNARLSIQKALKRQKKLAAPLHQFKRSRLVGARFNQLHYGMSAARAEMGTPSSLTMLLSNEGSPRSGYSQGHHRPNSILDSPLDATMYSMHNSKMPSLSNYGYRQQNINPTTGSRHIGSMNNTSNLPHSLVNEASAEQVVFPQYRNGAGSTSTVVTANTCGTPLPCSMGVSMPLNSRSTIENGMIGSTSEIGVTPISHGTSLEDNSRLPPFKTFIGDLKKDM